MKRADDEPDDNEEFYKRQFTAEQRQRMADRGQAMSGGGYPIANTKDLSNAIQAIGRAKNPDATRRHIIARARALGATSLLPDSWNVSKSLPRRIPPLLVLKSKVDELREAIAAYAKL